MHRPVLLAGTIVSIVALGAPAAWASKAKPNPKPNPKPKPATYLQYNLENTYKCTPREITMSAMRFLAIIAILSAAVQIAAAEDKKTTTKPSTGGAIEVQDYGFGVSMPLRASTKRKGGWNSTPSATRNAGKSGSKH